jgi:protease-4
MLGSALAVGVAATARAAVPTPEFPLTWFGNESVASTDGATGFLINPAAGGVRYPSELTLSLGEVEPDRRLLRGVWSAGGFLLGASDLEGRLRSQLVGFAAGSERLRLGWTGTRLDSRVDGDRVFDHALGMLARPAPWFSLGVTLSHAAEPRFESGRLGRTVTLGLGLRPLALSRARAHALGSRLTLTADLLLAEGAEREQARFRAAGELEIVPGISLRGSLEDHGSAQLGLGLSGTRAALHAQSAFDRDRRRRFASQALSVHRGEDATVLVGPRERRVAEIRIAGNLGDESLPGFSLFGGEASRSVAPIHRQLERALEDPLTRGVLLDLGGTSNMAQLEELRPRIARLRAAGKPVVAFLEQGGGRGDLYLAAACDQIVTTEEADFLALGLRAERRYYRKLLADWGLKIDRSSFGAYKSAYRNFSADSTPPEDREVIEHNLDVQQGLLVAALTGDRGIDRRRLLGLLDGRWWPPSELRKVGLIDSIGYREDALRMLGRRCGLGDKPRPVDLQHAPESRRAWTTRAPIAVVYASGAIETGRSGHDLLSGPTLGAETLVRQLERAFHDREVRAVVLRVESPGGSGLASNLILHATQRLKRETGKPFIVSMASVAASGGYYVALQGDRLFADRFTRTGSIGVLTVRPSLEGWYRRHGVRQDEFERGRYMGAWSLGRNWGPEFQAAADSAIYDFYRGFVTKVAEGRRLRWQDVDAVARGRVWMGEDALERKLIDELGGLEQAIAEARRRAGVPAGEKIRIAESRRPRPGWLERTIGGWLGEIWEQSAHLPEPGALYLWSDVEPED